MSEDQFWRVVGMGEGGEGERERERGRERKRGRENERGEKKLIKFLEILPSPVGRVPFRPLTREDEVKNTEK